MAGVKIGLIAVITLLLAAIYWLYWPPASPDLAVISNETDAIDRGEYLVTAGGCISCHQGQQDKESLSGGLALESDFGTFFVPNISPDPETGIGSWKGEDFILALKQGRSPTGSFYFPAFPYLAYAGLSDQDVMDMAAYLMSRPAVEYQTPDHETPPWLFRWMIAGWNKLAKAKQAPAIVTTDPLIARGSYLARNLGHCGECHTPRNSLGLADGSREFTGAELGDQTIEAIDAEALANWKISQFELFLFLGLKPDGEFAGGDMGDVIEHNTSRLLDEDRTALAKFFLRANLPE